MMHVPEDEVVEPTPAEASWWRLPYFRTYPEGEDLEGGNKRQTSERHVASVQSFSFILVGRTATDQRHRLPALPVDQSYCRKTS